jgi:lambda family phage portal protein
MGAWYNEERVAVKRSVILAKWNNERAILKRKEEAAQAPAMRMYGGAQVNRLTADWNAQNTSADSEILTSLRLLRARSRELVRDNAHAKNVIRIVQNNVVGTGIGLQAQVCNARGKLIDATNNQIEDAWLRWTDRKTCHTAGLLGLPDILRLVMGQLVEAGEVLIRKVKQPFGGGKIHFALEVLEADRLMDTWQTAQAPNGNAIRMGVEIDQWGRPTAYWLYPTHPGDYQFRTFVPSKFIRVPAEEMIHLYILERWPQTRGVPWFHAVLRKLNDLRGYEEGEIVKARASAAVMGFIQSPETPTGEETVNGQRLTDLSPGQIEHLLPGETFQGFNPSSPNTAMEGFMRHMLRSLAAGVGTSYESLTRDYSQSNYSSSRLALLDDRDLWRVLQGWLIRNCLAEIHREWLAQAVLAGEVKVADYFVSPSKYEKVRFKPRGWSWIDPTKEVNAFKIAVRSGFMTVSDVIAQTGGGQDAEDVFKSRRQELDMMADNDLIFDTDPAQTDLKGTGQANVPAEEADGAPATPAEPDGDDSAASDEPASDAGTQENDK